MAEQLPDDGDPPGADGGEKGRESPQLAKTDIEDDLDVQRIFADALTYKAPLEDLELIIKCGGRVNDPVKRGLRPLHYASYVNFAFGVQFLIDHGCDVNIHDDIGYTALHLCARRGNYETMKLLIENKAHVNYCDAGDEVQEKLRSLGYLSIEPLNLAIENNHVECARLLLENGAKADHSYFMGSEINLVPLENLACLELLLQHGANPNTFNRCGHSPLMKACKEHQIEAVRILLANGADVNLLCPSRFDTKTALHFAVQSGNIVITDLLLKNGAKTRRTSTFKYTPLHYAVLKDRVELCEILLDRGAEVDEPTDEGCTPLMLACASPNLKNRMDIVLTLLWRGADPNAHSSEYSYSAPCLSPITEYLINVSEEVSYEVIQTLLKYGARVTFKPASRILRMRDPFGILQYVSNLITKPDILELLLNAAVSFDVAAIARSRGAVAEVKDLLMLHASTPRPLKHLIRLELRMILAPDLPNKISLLPLPTILKSYLLFDVQ
ncbi:ankyrin-1-like [Liolophura sinensis]|uniref:ankyrin-1-like n=1 Tax=Liolophura sinensis TaxID=3198878 RepID=UPI003158C5B4